MYLLFIDYISSHKIYVEFMAGVTVVVAVSIAASIIGTICVYIKQHRRGGYTQLKS